MRRSIPALAVLLLLSLANPTLALEADDDTCTEVEAYASKLGKAERKRQEEESKQEALTEMARRVWEEAFRNRPEMGRTAAAFESLRFRYQVRERVEGGTYHAQGNKHAKNILYCMNEEQYDEAVKELRKRRTSTIETLQTEFARLEALVASDESEAASELLTSLDIEVVTEALESAQYTSPTGRTRPFYVWLLEWGDVVTRGPDYAESMLARARELIDAGRLDEADRYVSEALKVDREDPRAQDLRTEIQDRRNQRVELLLEAEKLAATARFDAAEKKLEEAMAIGSDDPLPIEELERSIDGKRAQYLQLNPRTMVYLQIALGSLGVDTNAIEDRVQEETGLVANGSSPLSFGVGADVRVSRMIQVSATGSWGVSQDENNFVGNAPLELYQLWQLTAGAGYATQRTSKRKISLQVSGGLAWELVDVNTLEATERSNKDSQLALYLRLAAQWRHASVFVQRGFGFDDDPSSLVGWSNGLQLGASVVF